MVSLGHLIRPVDAETSWPVLPHSGVRLGVETLDADPCAMNVTVEIGICRLPTGVLLPCEAVQYRPVSERWETWTGADQIYHEMLSIRWLLLYSRESRFIQTLAFTTT